MIFEDRTDSYIDITYVSLVKILESSDSTTAVKYNRFCSTENVFLVLYDYNK